MQKASVDDDATADSVKKTSASKCVGAFQGEIVTAVVAVVSR